VSVDRDSVWVTSARDGTLTRYSVRSGDLKTIELGGTPMGLDVGQGGVWTAVAATSKKA
jgi:hypothetical protein